MSVDQRLTSVIIYGRDIIDEEGFSKEKALITIIVLVAISTLVIGGCVAGGVLSVSTAGWTVLALSVVGLNARLGFNNLKERIIYVFASFCVAATFIILGALGGAGILSASQLGWGIIGTSLVSPVFKAIFINAQSGGLLHNPSLGLF